MKIEMEVDPVAWGKALAHSYDELQAAILNALASELSIACGGRHRDVEMQHCYISDKLDKNGREFIKSLAAFVKLREEKP